MSNPIKPKGPRHVPVAFAPSTWASTYLTSTVGAKVLVGVTGTLLTGFVVFHMIGNAKVLFGRDEFNAYAHFLKHSLGPYLWMARAGLLAAFLAHVGLVVWLKTKTAAARPVQYQHARTAQATLASRTMLLTGLVIGAFIVFHLAHYTFGWVHEAPGPDGTPTNYLNLTQRMPDGSERHDVYSMTIAGFRTPWISVTYLVAVAFLYAHLSHGIQSTIQTFGLKGTRMTGVWTAAGSALAAFIVLGNVAIVVAIWTGLVPPVTTP